MDCPQCKGYELEPTQIEPGLVAASCCKCNGVMLPLMNYRYWLDHAGVGDESEDLGAASSSLPIVEDSTQAKLCPKCTRIMTKYSIGTASEKRIELCTNCDEVWLDNGEWRLLKALDMQDKLPKIFTDAWQRNIRLQRQSQSDRRHYRNLLGEEDFNKSDEFKQWLDLHPDKALIYQFLMTKLNL
jgi:Zn-finger nucleic acid-binding protein